MKNVVEGSFAIQDELVDKAVARLAESEAVSGVAAANDKTWADALPDEAAVLADAKLRAEKKVIEASTYLGRDPGTMKAIQSFREYIDGLSDAEKLEAVGMDASKFAVVETDPYEDYRDRLVLELLVQMYQTVANVASDKELSVRDATKLVSEVLVKVNAKLTA